MSISTKKILTITFLCGFSFICGAFITQKLENSPITVAVVNEAEKITGIEFSLAQADSMLTGLNEHRKAYEELRKLHLPNNVVPALNFNPIPVGFVYPDKTNEFLLDKRSTANMPADKNALAFYTIRQLADLVRTKKISSVELTKFFIERLRKYNPKLLFVVNFTEELALKQAAQADAEIKAGHYKGILHGIPFGVKDLLAAKGYKTTWGSVPYKNQELDIDATVVKKLEAAGAVLVAKLTLGELASGDVWFGGRTNNPWDIKRGSSGSSAGPASAVSAGCLPFAIGSETLGSIVSPSTECGDTGLRPSFGRVSKTGAMALSWTMDKLGPITRSAEDCAIVFNAIQGTDPQDLSTIAAPFKYDGKQKSLKGWKIGYLKTDFDRSRFNRESDSSTLIKLKELGAALVPIELPTLPYNSLRFILETESGTAFQELVLNHQSDLMVRQGKGGWPNIFRTAQFVPAVEYIQANRVRTMVIQDWYEKLKGLDMYIAPAFSGNLVLTNLTGNPCVVLPNGFNKQGRPVSITFMGQLFGEGKILEAAKIYQDATDFNKKHPELNF
ncbi:amidase [Mucilaginibacter arboris]|uniref:Amidase n=1 Tax=Mucilaginibacter arboris TaxID=2682090 RepID=A0A7K1SS08_9SPHI|nr:amidase [Mucilaginibacter arboris]MVN20109.1 amidase [Mucilaginibacter arboris]